MSPISRNQTYLLDRFERSGCRRGLDYGCGDGDLVAAAVTKGYDFWGTDPYYNEAEYRAQSESKTPDAARDRIRLLGADNTVPWPDATFDWVCSGQVFEHVHYLDRAIAELARVTKPGGLGLHNFPTVERIRESHNGVPYYIRVPPQIRAPWAKACYKAGIAYRFDHDDVNTWWTMTSEWHDRAVVLRRAAVVKHAFARYFDIQDVAVDKLSFHLKTPLPNARALSWLEARRHGITLLMTRR